MRIEPFGKNGNMFGDIYKKKKVLTTGHTGFKGSWLALWLKKLGADVYGIALNPQTVPSHYNLLNLDINSIIGDIRDYEFIKEQVQKIEPDLIFHLAAQAIVRDSYDIPRETYDTNVMGTLNVFEACRNIGSVKAIINVTSDKCYENKEQIWGYREKDSLGGYDPYSSSKACSELLTNSYRNSFFNASEYGKKHNVLIASARAGNVIGGGDWATDRLVPDIMKATANNASALIRNPHATRPWQHVLEPLSGYLLLGSELLKGNVSVAESWNFGPADSSNLSVLAVCNYLEKYWDSVKFDFDKSPTERHEANFLKLDCSKAHSVLKWSPVWDNETCFKKTAEWYKNYYKKDKLSTQDDLKCYIMSAIEKQMNWVT